MNDKPKFPNRFTELVDTGAAAANAGDTTGAEKLFREALSIVPNHPVVLHNLALVLIRSQRQKEGEAVLIQAAQTGAVPASLILLGDIFGSSGREVDSVTLYEAALKKVPGEYDVLMKLGGVKDKTGDKAGATECYRLALAAKPRDPAATDKYSNAIFAKDPETAVRLSEEALAGAQTTETRVRILNSLILQKEWLGRIRLGQEAYHAGAVEDLLFNHARAYVQDLEASNRAIIAANPANATAQVGIGTARFCLGDRHTAENYWRSAKTPGHILEIVKFSRAFYDELRAFSVEDIYRGLPPLIDVTPLCPDAKGVLYLSCNFDYFHAFTLPMLVSLRARSPKTPVHIHIMDGSEAHIDFARSVLERLAPLKYALSVERPNLQNAPVMEGRCYYHAVRFFRFLEHLKRYDCPLWLMDVDAVINRDLDDLFSRLTDRDLSMRIRPGRMEPWNQFNACVVGASTSATSMRYLHLVAAYIAYFHQRKMLRWGIDQLAMYGVFEDMRDRGESPGLALLGEREVDYTYRDDGFVWCNSGAGKFRHLQRISNPNSAAPAVLEDNRFVGVFEDYWHQVQAIITDLGIKIVT